MNQEFKIFRNYMETVDYTHWQEQIAREYLAIGDSEYWGGKLCGSDAENKGSRYLADKLREIGVEKVNLIPVVTDRCQFNDATLSFIDEQKPDIKPYCNVSAGTPAEGIITEIVDCGMGTKEELDAADIEGKIVLICSNLDITEANPFLSISFLEIQERGAAAVLVWTKGVADNTNMAVMNAFAINMPVCSIIPADAQVLSKTKGKVKLTVDCEIIPDGGTTYEVVGEIPGSESDERIVYTAHLDHYHRCLQDNVSAVITVLGIARAMVESGFKPRRTITFVFNGSHELGHVLSTSPDLKGPYELFQKIRPDIPAKAIANINFEYTAMDQHELRSMTSYETIRSYLDFIGEMPDTCSGFEKIATDVRAEDYYLLTWCDAVISIISGVPCYMNDAIGDQIYVGDSPYMGRDHSNADNWDIFSADALRTCTRWYGTLAAFLDSRAYVEMDFAKRAEAIALSEEDKQILDVCSISYDAFDKARDKLSKSGEELYAKVKEANKSAKAITEIVQQANEKILNVHRQISWFTDHFMANIITTLMPAHKAYTGNLGMMCRAKVMLQEGKFEDAVGLLSYVDIAGLAYQFEGKYIDQCVEYIAGKNATWTKDRVCKCFPMTELMKALKIKGPDVTDYADEMKLLDEQIAQITEILQKQIDDTAAGITKAADEISLCLELIG